LLAIAFGDLFVAVITKMFSQAENSSGSVSAPRFFMYAGMTFLVAIVFSVIATFYRYRDQAAAEGK
jgi:predicted histidine transporter YuiF (NhaC family)